MLTLFEQAADVVVGEAAGDGSLVLEHADKRIVRGQDFAHALDCQQLVGILQVVAPAEEHIGHAAGIQAAEEKEIAVYNAVCHQGTKILDRPDGASSLVQA